MNNSEIENQLKTFMEEEKTLLDKHKDKSFDTEQEGAEYIQENESELSRLNELSVIIEGLEKLLRTPKDQQEYDDYLEGIRKKYSKD
jgi:hypothetical protein